MMTTRVFGATRSLFASASVSTKAAGVATRKTKESSGSKSSTTTIQKSKGNPDILKEIPVSPAMSKFLGVTEISRSQAVKKIWEYVKQKQLQNPEDRRKITCDDNLKTIFAGKDEVGMFEIGKLLSAHFIKPK